MYRCQQALREEQMVSKNAISMFSANGNRTSRAELRQRTSPQIVYPSKFFNTRYLENYVLVAIQWARDKARARRTLKER